MYYNPNIIFSIILSIGFFILGLTLSKNINSKVYKYLLIISSLLLSFPGFSMVLYYTHLIEIPTWYIQFRTLKGIEISNSLIGLFLGLISGSKIKNFFLIGMTFLLVLIPYIKPIIRPIAVNEQTEWKNGVCMQTCQSSCGPSSLATIYEHYGIKSSELDISKNSYTCSSGTEIWYILRYANEHNLNYKLKTIRTTAELDCPCIIGTKINGIGHFITVLDIVNQKLLIGDPLIGKLELGEEEFRDKYELDGLMIQFLEKSNQFY